MKLYELKRGTYFKLQEDTEAIFKLDHIDGMYSMCYTEQGDMCHIYAFAEVIPCDEISNL